MNFFKIPMTNVPQRFGIVLAGVKYILTCKWNDALDGAWILDIDDSISGSSIVAGIPLVPGSDLLSGFEYLGINGSLYVYTDGNPDALPTLENMGVDANLFFATEIA